MGLFSSKKKTTVGTTVSRVIEDDAMPDAMHSAILKAVMSEEGDDIPSYILEEILASVGVRAERMYAYARDHYTHGLPSGEFLVPTLGKNEAEAILEADAGEPVLINYCRFGPPNSLHIAWWKLFTNYGYDQTTNQIGTLSAQIGHTVYLKNIEIVIPQNELDSNPPGSLDQWGPPATAGYIPGRPNGSSLSSHLRSHTPVVVSDSAIWEHARVTYCWQEALGAEIQEDTMTLSLSEFDDEADYFHVKFTVGSAIKYWLYKAGTGGHPSLDGVFESGQQQNGSFFPFAYFRFNKASEVENQETEAFQTTNKMLRYLNIDYVDVAEAIDENPDIADVEQAMLMMGVPAASDDPLELRYLFEFFDNLYYASDNQFETPIQAAITSSLQADPDLTRSTIVIEDARFKMALSNAGIYKKKVAGNLGEVGTHTREITVENVRQTYVDDDSGLTLARDYPVISHFYRKQITHGLYEEIRVVNLQMRYHIFGNYTATGDGEDEILLIPLDHSITEHYSLPDREVLYARSLHYVFNSVVVTKIKWYQQGFFRAVLLVVAVIITVASFAADGGALLAAVAAGSAAAIGAATWVIITRILYSLIIRTVLRLFVKAVGVEFAMILAAVTAVYGSISAIRAGSLEGAPWASEMLSASSGLAQSVGDRVSELMGELAAEASEFDRYIEEQTKVLETAEELLETNNTLSPFVIFGESPNDFYNRTVHSGNIGQLSISAVSSFVDISLTLPKLEDTMGEFSNAS